MSHSRGYVRKHNIVPESRGTWPLVTLPPVAVRQEVIRRLWSRMGVAFDIDDAARPLVSIHIGGRDSIASLEQAHGLFETALSDCLKDFQAGLLGDQREQTPVVLANLKTPSLT